MQHGVAAVVFYSIWLVGGTTAVITGRKVEVLVSVNGTIMLLAGLKFLNRIVNIEADKMLAISTLMF